MTSSTKRGLVASLMPALAARIEPQKHFPELSNQRGVVPFDPSKAKKWDALADSAIAFAKKVKDWPMLEKAVDQKIEDQTEFVAWWRATVTPNLGAGRGNKNQRRPGLILQSVAEALTEISHQQVARWRQRLAMYGENVRGRSGDDEWFTPAEVLVPVRAVLGTIDLDPASDREAQKIVQARRFFTKADDGLNHSWRGKIFLNPPYSIPLITQFVAKLIQELQAGRVTAAIVLVNNSTDALWFHKLLGSARAVCLALGRLRFWKPSGEGSAAPQGQAFFYFGNEPDRFIEQFARFGFVLPLDGGVTRLSEAAE
jgi:phage N-6-adenine-methyltransferase